MELKELLSKSIWRMTGGEFTSSSRHASTDSEARTPQPATDTDKRCMYGVNGIAHLFGCSMPTVNRIKESGKMSRVITQIGRKIIADAELALELTGRKSGGRK